MGEIELLALAGRVEGLSGPDRALDAEIAWLTRWRWDGWEDEDVRIEDRSLEYVIERVENGFNSIWRNVPRYTASLDAAMSLVPKGSPWKVQDHPDWSVSAVVDVEEGYATTAALALCAAALRAITSQEGE